MSTIGEALEATFEERYRALVADNVRLVAENDRLKVDREKASGYSIALQRICETMRRVACGEEPGYLQTPESMAGAPFYAAMVPLVVDAVKDLRADLVNAARVAEQLTAERNDFLKLLAGNCGCTDEADIPCANCKRIDEYLTKHLPVDVLGREAEP